MTKLGRFPGERSESVLRRAPRLLRNLAKRRTLAAKQRVDGLTGLLTPWLDTVDPDKRPFGITVPWLADLAADAVLIGVDIVRLRAVNYEHGHLVGDALLVDFAARLRHASSPWPAFRCGGDEFFVATRCGDDMEIAAMIAGIQTALEQPYAERPKITVSMAAARAWPGADFEAVFAALDAAVFAARRSGCVWLSSGPYDAGQLALLAPPRTDHIVG